MSLTGVKEFTQNYIPSWRLTKLSLPFPASPDMSHFLCSMAHGLHMILLPWASHYYITMGFTLLLYHGFHTITSLWAPQSTTIVSPFPNLMLQILVIRFHLPAQCRKISLFKPITEGDGMLSRLSNITCEPIKGYYVIAQL